MYKPKGKIILKALILLFILSGLIYGIYFIQYLKILRPMQIQHINQCMSGNEEIRDYCECIVYKVTSNKTNKTNITERREEVKSLILKYCKDFLPSNYNDLFPFK